MAAPNYDEMEADSAEEEATESEDDATEEAAEQDDEFLMHAEEAGFTGEKAAALWRAVARCVELTQGGGSPMTEEEEPLV